MSYVVLPRNAVVLSKSPTGPSSERLRAIGPVTTVEHITATLKADLMNSAAVTRGQFAEPPDC